MSTLSGKTLFITGASRGIGLAIALRAARDGANVAIAAKSDVPNPKLPGTIHTAAQAVDDAGGRGLALKCDIREEDQVRAAVAATVEAFGGIDILVNNASAIWLRGTLDTPMKRFDLMQQVNARGSFLCAQACLPHLLQADNPHILTLAPPPSLDPKWWGPHTGYTLAKRRSDLRRLAGPRAARSEWPTLLLARMTSLAPASADYTLGGIQQHGECQYHKHHYLKACQPRMLWRQLPVRLSVRFDILGSQ